MKRRAFGPPDRVGWCWLLMSVFSIFGYWGMDALISLYIYCFLFNFLVEAGCFYLNSSVHCVAKPSRTVSVSGFLFHSIINMLKISANLLWQQINKVVFFFSILTHVLKTFKWPGFFKVRLSQSLFFFLIIFVLV